MVSERQEKVAMELYMGNLSEQEICEKYRLRPRLLRRWLDSDEFQAELTRLQASSRREARFIVARYGPVAALRLAELLSSDKPDIARRAALDMVDRCLARSGAATQDRTDPPEQEITEEQAQQMLLTLAAGLKRHG